MKLLCCLWLLLLGTSVFAAEDFCRDLQERYDLPTRLAHLHPRDRDSYHDQLETIFRRAPIKVGWVDSRTIQREIRTIKLCVNTSETPLTGSGSRHGSVYFTKERIIVLNRDRVLGLNDTPENSLLIIHETLGVLGYPDENYELTSLWYAKAQEQEFGLEVYQVLQLELEKELKGQVRSIENVVTREGEGSGGISGVGGGGDPEVAFFKPIMAAMLLTNPDFFGVLCGGVNNLPNVARYILMMRLETDDVVQFPRVPSGSPHLFFAFVKGEIFIQIEHAAWLRLRERGDAAYDERHVFIRNLTTLSCVMEKNSHE